MQVKRTFFIVLAAFLLLAPIFADTFILTHIDHDCSHDDCPVCLQIALAQHLQDLIIVIGTAALFTACFSKTISKPIKNFISQAITLVSLKVKITS